MSVVTTRRGMKTKKGYKSDIGVVILPVEEKKLGAYGKEVLRREKISEEETIEVPLLIPCFHNAKEITEKTVEKSIYLKTKFDITKTVSIPKLYFWERLGVTIKPYENNLIMSKTLMYKIIIHILNNIPEIGFESSTMCEPVKVATNFIKKLRTVSERIWDFVSTPKIIFLESSEVSTKECSRDLTFRKNVVSNDFGTPFNENEKLKFTDSLQIMPKADFKLSINRPLIILARKPKNKRFEYIELLKRILREIYRIQSRGLPKPVHVEASDFDEIKIKQDIRAEEHLWVLDLEGIEIKPNYLKDRFKELYSQNFGFLVLYGNEEKLNEVKKILKLDSPLPKYYEISITEDNSIFKIVQVMWGMLGERTLLDLDLDTAVVKFEDLYFDKIEELANDISTVISIEPSVEDEENLGAESIIHYALKAFVVEYFRKNLKINESKIWTEYEFANGRLDVFVSDPKLGKIAVEIETLYGSGLPILKLRKRIESRLKMGLKLWLVIPNPQLMIYLKDILTLRNIYKKKYGDKIEFFGIDFSFKKIIQITELLKILHYKSLF